MFPVLGVCIVSLLLFILFLVLWFRSREEVLTERLVLTHAFPTEVSTTEISELYHPRIRNHMYNYNPSIFLFRGKRHVVHRLSTFNMCQNILRHIPQFTAMAQRHGVLNSIVLQTPTNHIIFIEYPQNSHFPCPESYDDPRSLLYRDQLVLIVNNAQHARCHRTMVALFIDMTDMEDLECVAILRPSRIVELSYKKSRRVEKNWMPFVYRDKLYFVYSVNPHVILRCDTETGTCTEAAVTHYRDDQVSHHLRGGTPCLFLPQKNCYLTAVHNRHSIAGVKLVYTSVLYLFEAQPPFRIVAVSPEFFMDDDFETHRFKQIIQFVAGMVLDASDGRLYISYGVADCHSKVLSLPLDSVMALLRPVRGDATTTAA